MRDIKFRAWNTEKKIMYPPSSIWKMNLYDYEESYNLNLMQYTGLKDKNDKEIYEGDIVRNYWTCNYKKFDQPPIYKVVFKNASFGFQSKPKYGNYQNVSNKYWPAELCKSDNWEIIGNIYENPELLKE